MCTFYRGTSRAFCLAASLSLQRVLPQDPPTHSESSWEDRWCLSPLPPGHLQHPSHPQSPLHCRWSHPPNTQLLQSAAIREETAESPGEDQQTKGQLHTSGCQEAQLSPDSAPSQVLSLPLPLVTVTSTSHFVQHWTDLIQLPLMTVSKKTVLRAFCHFKQTDKLFCNNTDYICTVSLFDWFALMLLYLFYMYSFVYF